MLTILLERICVNGTLLSGALMGDLVDSVSEMYSWLPRYLSLRRAVVRGAVVMVPALGQ